jgi:hypothetical protein
MFHHRPLLPFALLFVFALLASPQATAGWSTIQTPHCKILSQLPEGETRAWASEFEQFNAAARGILVLDEQVLPPLTVVLFEQGQFDRYKPRSNDRRVRKSVAGLCGTGSDGAIIAFAQIPDRYETRHILFHETTHWLLHASRTAVPLWINEGLAETLATFAPGPEYGTLGLTDRNYVDLLQTETGVPWEKVLRTTHYDPLYRGDPKLVRLFYAKSWLCVHRLLFLESANGTDALDRHTRARLHGANPPQAFAIAIERDFDLAETQMLAYARSGRATRRRVPCPPEAKITAPYVHANQLETESVLASLALGARRFEVATKHIQRIRTLAPESPAGLEFQASIELMNDRKDAAYALAKQAVAAGSNDAELLTFIADRDLAKVTGDSLDDTELRRLATPFLHALEKHPRSDDAYCGYARMVTRLHQPTEEDAKLLTAGCEFFPDDTWPFVGLASIRYRQDNVTEARRLLGLALSRLEVAAREKAPDSDDIATPKELGPRAKHIETLVADGNIADAIVAFEALLEIPLPKD